MLFLKECKKILFSLTFVIYLAAVIGFYFTQFVPETKEKISQPVQGLDDYGTAAKEVPEILMPEAAEGLVAEYLIGCYSAYPFGFHKEVKLSPKKSAEIAEIITEITGITKQELDNFNFADFDENEMTMIPDGNGGYMPAAAEISLPEINIPDTMTYERFRDLMRRADKLIGGGSKYSDDFIIDNFSLVPKTYEDALAEYNDIFEKDKVTGAYARLFCDYIGIIVSILPVFTAVALVSADKKSSMQHLIYTRNISSVKLIVTRFSALAVMLSVPVLLLAFSASLSVSRLYPENNVDIFAIPKMSIYWLVPNILFSTALGMALSEILTQVIAVFAQGVIWFGSVMSSLELTGDIGRFTLVCRHNSLYERNIFLENIGKFAFNRIFYTVLSLAIIILTISIYSAKRKGGFNVVRKNTIGKSKA